MLDEEKLKKAFKIICYNLDKLREDVEEFRKKLNDLEQRVDNIFKVGENLRNLYLTHKLGIS